MAIDTEAKTSFCKRKKEEEGRKVREYGKEEGGEKRKGIFFFDWLCGFCWIVYIAASSGDTILAGAPSSPSLRVASQAVDDLTASFCFSGFGLNVAESSLL